MKENKYEEIIKELVEDFTKTIPNSENERELINSFEKYLYNLIEAINNSQDIKEKDEEFIKYVLRYSTEITKELPLIQKKQKLIEDKCFEEIERISAYAFKIVQEIILGKEIKRDEKELKELKQKLKENLSRVRDFNKNQAQWLVSEGMLDLGFIEDPNKDIMSLRAGNYKKKINEIIKQNKNETI